MRSDHPSADGDSRGVTWSTGHDRPNSTSSEVIGDVDETPVMPRPYGVSHSVATWARFAEIDLSGPRAARRPREAAPARSRRRR